MFPPPYRRPLGRQQIPFHPVTRPTRQPLFPPFAGGTPQRQRRDLLKYFRKEDGTVDFKKMSATASQIKGVYDQVVKLGPMFTNFLGR